MCSYTLNRKANMRSLQHLARRGGVCRKLIHASAARKISGGNGLGTLQTQLEKICRVEDASENHIYEVDWLKKYHGKASAVVSPGSAQEVQAIVRVCSEAGVPIVPQGGNTGLVGGSVPLGGEVVMSMRRMNHILGFDEGSAVISAEAGCTLQALQDTAGRHGYDMPLDLAARGSCQLGGVLATNAGGINFVRHGSLQGSLRGLQFVDGTGALVDLMTTHAKDNTGLHLKNLMVGSEGTLGIITAAAVATPASAPHQQTALLAAGNFQQIVKLMQRARRYGGGALAAFEFFDSTALATVLQHSEGCSDPLPEPFPYYALVQLVGQEAAQVDDAMDGYITGAMAAGEYVEGTVAASAAQEADLWRLREDVAPAASTRGLVLKYDVSLAPLAMQQLVQETALRLQSAAREGRLPAGARVHTGPQHTTHGGGASLQEGDITVMGYGHMADGNLHLNVTLPWAVARDAEGAPSVLSSAVQHELEPWVYERVLQLRGSISAEHGMGQAKAAWLSKCKGAAAVDAMRRVKAAMDPRGILNPGKVLPLPESR